MTVKELKAKLANLPDTMPVAVYREIDSDTEFYDISDVSPSKGTPKRLSDGTAGFTFENNGPAEWLFISIDQA